MSAPKIVACSTCTASAPVPDDGDHSPLWDAGWRWIGHCEGPPKIAPTTHRYSCPACPPVTGR